MSVNDWLMVAALVAAVASRWWVVAVLAAAYCAQSAVDHAGWLDAYGYYLSVALIDALFVLIIHLKSPVSRHLRIAQLICALFIPVQIGGLVMWYLYGPPLVYNVACSVLYMALITTIISRDKKRARNRKGFRHHIIHDSDWRHGSAMAAKDEVKG
ncbi:hypothetical protein phiA005_0036 [Aeromonas phage phiA005]|nr:hypothetical protein phiA005_0036 [Aeromonas phage phiA005]